jgi:hypothetical protein
MRFTRHHALPYALALALLCVSYLAYASSGTRGSTEATTPPLHTLTSARGAKCPLPVGKQVQAVKAFREMLPVFRHPRCLNCHGGVDPLSEAHRGADQLDPEVDRMTDREAFEAQCQECHDGLPGWNTPGQPVFFTGKDDEELCLQMKRFERTGASFIEHLDNDHHGIQFIAAGFAGDRALGEGLKDYGLAIEKPPGTQADLVAKARKWVDLLGPGYEASPECGCVPPKIKLKVEHTWLFETPGGVPSRQASAARFEVQLEPYGDERPDYFRGQFSLVRRVDMRVPKFCKANTSVKESWEFNALLDKESGFVKVWHSQISDAPTGEIVCRARGGTARMKADPGTLAGLLGAGEMVIPADSTRRKRAAFQGMQESLAITVLAVPDGK